MNYSWEKKTINFPVHSDMCVHDIVWQWGVFVTPDVLTSWNTCLLVQDLLSKACLKQHDTISTWVVWHSHVCITSTPFVLRAQEQTQAGSWLMQAETCLLWVCHYKACADASNVTVFSIRCIKSSYFSVWMFQACLWALWSSSHAEQTRFARSILLQPALQGLSCLNRLLSKCQESR